MRSGGGGSVLKDQQGALLHTLGSFCHFESKRMCKLHHEFEKSVSEIHSFWFVNCEGLFVLVRWKIKSFTFFSLLCFLYTLWLMYIIFTGLLQQTLGRFVRQPGEVAAKSHVYGIFFFRNDSRVSPGGECVSAVLLLRPERENSF